MSWILNFRSFVYTGFKLGKSAMQLYYELCQVFGQASAPSLRTIQRWVAAIRGGTFTLEKETSLGRPSSTKTPTMIMKVDDLITSDPRLSVRDVAIALHIDSTTVRSKNEQDIVQRADLTNGQCVSYVHIVQHARIQDYFKGTGATIFSQSAYRPDLNLCDRFLFSHLQQHCRGLEYLDGDELYHDVQHYLRRLPEELMKHELEKLLIHCRGVIREGGGYVTS